MAHDEKEKLQRKRRSYQSARVGAIFLTIMAALATAGVLATEGVNSIEFTQMYWASFIMLAGVYICHLKVQIMDLKLDLISGDA